MQRDITPIFIGGTGRSGTTVLGRTLSLHGDIFTIPFESRFIVDPDGVESLIHALHEQWEQYSAHTAIERFRKLMRSIYPSRPVYLMKILLSVILPKIHISPPKYAFTFSKFWKDEEFFNYKKQPFSLFADRKKFFEIVESFLSHIIVREYSGFWTGYGTEIAPRMNVTTYSPENALKQAREFIDSLIIPVVKKYGAKRWADHTPTNINHVLFLKRLYPEMKFIHIYRDPRDVVSSYKTKSWGGNSAMDAVPIINGTLRKWEEDKKRLPDGSYIEISLEELVSNKKETLEKLCNFLELDFDENMLKMDLSKSHSGRWKKDLSSEEVKLIEEKLGWFMEKYGYS